MIKKSNKALVLLSGGLDSTVVLSICKKEGYEVHAISFNYGQRHSIELEFAKYQANFFKCISHRIFNIEFFGGSALTDDISVPENRTVEEIPKEIPIEFREFSNITQVVHRVL